METRKFSSSFLVLSILILIQFFTGCAVVPPQIWRPWTRTLGGDTNIPLYSNLYISVEGNTQALAGDERLLQDEIKDIVAGLVQRRGFKVIDKPGDYNLKLTYRTFRNDRINSWTSTSVNNKNAFVSYNGYNSNAALGVMIASAIFGMAGQSGTTVENSTETTESYTHIIAIEIFKGGSELIWKGESAWDSDNLDLTGDIIPSLQLLISWLPNDNNTFPQVAEIKKSKQDNYYNLKCKGRYFSCPALPNRIAFSYDDAWEKEQYTGSPNSIANPEAYDAYLDLLQTAEYALPLGGDDYMNPLDKNLWSEVELGGKYYIGHSIHPLNILIKLTGTDQGYKVERCCMASNEEFRDFQNKLFNWQKALKDYYDLRE